jgi:RNA polymerase sigma-54 factor
MTVSQRLELRQGQALVMTARLQQSLKMLRMPNLELADHVAALVEANPLLETRAAPVRDSLPRSPAAVAEGPDAIDFAVAPVSLREHLRAQLGLTRSARPALAAALALVEELEDDGYLRGDLEEVAERRDLPVAALEEGLALVQELDPAGVGARSLAECFRLQLADRGELDEAMACLLENLALLAAGRAADLAARCGIEPEDLPEQLRRLRRLDPKPGLAFSENAVAVVVPDVFVRRTETGWEVEINSETLPRVLVNNAYAARIRTHDKETLRYVSECRTQAAWLVRSLEQRARTILAVASAIVSHQELFFARGVSALKPLSQRALAEKIGMHESTVSRVTASKFLSCDLGTFSLRSFFSQSLPTRDSEGVSAAAVQARIRALLGAEDPARPLSDDRIVTVLNRDGIDIARRTVAKYREGMGIPSSVERRRLRAPGGVGP